MSQGFTSSDMRTWVIETVLPFWANRCWDNANPGFVEALSLEGEQCAGDARRVRVQARQIYTFATAASEGMLPVGADIAQKGFETYLRQCFPDGLDSGCVHVIAADGTITDNRRDLYDQAFALLAASGMIRLSSDPRAKVLAESVGAFIDQALASDYGGWQEDSLNTLPRRQNPHMHLFEASMALFAATGDDAWQARAAKIYDLFTNYFFDCDQGLLFEFFADDWSRCPDKGSLIEPGHMMEWAWLLSEFGRRFATDTSNEVRVLHDGALAAIKDPGALLLPNSVRAHSTDKSSSRRLWPQTEHLRALCALDRLGTFDIDRSNAVANAIFHDYIEGMPGGLWCDEVRLDGTRISEKVPASILYHLIECAMAMGEHVPAAA
ncbi:MAG: AGE family epimerase/isomerase [Pseudomonadota bacterium]